MPQDQGSRAQVLVPLFLAGLAAACAHPPPPPSGCVPESVLIRGGLELSLWPLCRAVLRGDEQALPGLAGHPLVAKMAEGMRAEVGFSPEEYARAAFAAAPDPRFSWERLRRNRAHVEPLVTELVGRHTELVARALAAVGELLPEVPAAGDVRLNLVCGSPWDAFVLVFEVPEVFLDLGFYADAPPAEALPGLEAILTHELWHVAFLAHQDRRWKTRHRDTASAPGRFLYRMLNEGVGHYFSLRPELLRAPGEARPDLAERERTVFALLAERYPGYRDEPDEKRREELLWRSHAGVPFWEKWGAVPGALVVHRLVGTLGPAGVRALFEEEPFTWIVEYERLAGEHPDWPKLPARLVADARQERSLKGARAPP